MSQQVVGIVLLLLPLFIGAIIAAINADSANGATEKAEEWIRTRQRRTSTAKGWFSAYVLNPLLWGIVKFSNWTDAFSHRGLKNGTRIAATLYLVALWLLLLYAAVMIVIAIVAVVIVLFVAAKILGGSGRKEDDTAGGDDVARERDYAVARAGHRGQRVYSGTSWFNEELQGRVDDEGYIYKGTSWINEERVGRIDDEGNIYSGTSWMNEEKVGRIGEDGTLYKGSNWFTEQKTGRIAEDGSVYEGTNWFNEKQTGRVGD